MSGGGGFGLGSIGSSLGKVASSALKPVNLAGSAVGSLGGVGTVLGPALQLAGGASPLGVFGSSLAGEVLKGYTEKGGSSERPAFVDASGNPIYAQRGYNYGANTYQVSNNPFDASKYFISGNKGVYNLLPMMSSLYDDQGLATRPGSTSYNLYQNIYDKMADDAAAQKAFSERFSVREFNPFDVMSDTQRQIYSSGYTPHPMFNPNRGFSTPGEVAANRNKPQYDIYGGSIFDTRFNKADQVPSYLRDDFNRTFAEYNPLKNFESSGRRFRAPTISPIKYVDFGFGPEETFKDKPLKLIADYASQNKNPFFLAYAPEASAPAPTLAPETPMASAPVSAPAPTLAPETPMASAPALAPFTAPTSTIVPETPMASVPTPAPTPTPFTAPTPTLAPFTAPASTVAPTPAPAEYNVFPMLREFRSPTQAASGMPIRPGGRFQSLAERANQISEEAAAERARRGRR